MMGNGRSPRFASSTSPPIQIWWASRRPRAHGRAVPHLRESVAYRTRNLQ
jgi:hypothetical protein